MTVARQRTTGESLRHIELPPGGWRHVCHDLCGTFTKWRGSVRCSDQAASRREHTGPVPHRDGNSALGVMGTPKQDFCPRMRKERNYIAQKSILSTNRGQVLTSACCTLQRARE